MVNINTYNALLEKNNLKHNDVVSFDDGRMARVVGYHQCYDNDNLLIFYVCDLEGDDGWNKSQLDDHDFVVDVDANELIHFLLPEEIIKIKEI